jgi:hypothetical protein
MFIYLEPQLYGNFVKNLFEMIGIKTSIFWHSSRIFSKKEGKKVYYEWKKTDFSFLRKWEIKFKPYITSKYVGIAGKIDTPIVDEVINEMMGYKWYDPELRTPLLVVICSHEGHLEIKTTPENFKEVKNSCKKALEVIVNE